MSPQQALLFDFAITTGKPPTPGTPDMPEEKRNAYYKGWKKAVTKSYDWID